MSSLAVRGLLVLVFPAFLAAMAAVDARQPSSTADAARTSGTSGTRGTSGTLETQSLLRWFKGNTHTHTLNSDGDSSPDDMVRWYRDAC